MRSCLPIRPGARRACVSAAFAAAAVCLAVLSAAPRTLKASPFMTSRPPGIFPSDRGPSAERPAKGKFLVATRQVGDPRFMETVILLVQYGLDGVVGIIINRPTEVKLADAFPEFEGLAQTDRRLFFGGPVAMEQVHLLIRSGSRPEESARVFDDVYASNSSAVLERMAREKDTDAEYRAYAGYAGWAHGQLGMELARGDWLVVRADAETIFEKPPGDIWPELFRRASAIQAKARVGAYSGNMRGIPVK